MTGRFFATYRIRSDAGSIEARAQAIAVEQSVEMPLEAIDAPEVRRDIVGRVEAIEDCRDGCFEVRIALAGATVGADAGQLLNMAFGNTSLQEDTALVDLTLPPEMAARIGGPGHGAAGLRARCGSYGRALTCAALKPQGLTPEALAGLAARFARGGVDFVKDDHGLADQHYAPFAARVAACAEAVQRVGHTRYVPSLSGDLQTMRNQLVRAREVGVDTALVAPMITGFATIQALRREFPEIALIAHPTMGGAARIAPELLIGRLFPLIGADAVIFPNHGGRFSYTPQTCQRLAAAARAAGPGLRPALPVPAGGMNLSRVPEMLDFYGQDAMLLIGGSLLSARERLTEETTAFVNAVASHRYGRTP